MEESKVLRLVYTFFLGVLIALFVGFGINTFYAGPSEPDYPYTTDFQKEEPAPAQLEAERQYQKDYDAFSAEMESYSRNVSIIATLAAVALLSASILYDRKIKFIADGVMFGGLLTLLYGIIRALVAGDSKYTFIVTAVSLGVVIYLGYHRFVKPTEKPTKK